MPRNFARHTGLVAHAGLQRARDSALAASTRRAAALLAEQGQGGDRHLIHVDEGKLATMRHAFARGRAGRRNPVTGLESFAPDEDMPAGDTLLDMTSDASGDSAPAGMPSSGGGVPVVLPNGEALRLASEGQESTLLSPVADLRPVAAAGRKAGQLYSAMLNDPEGGPAALTYLALNLRHNLGQGGVFDYQRQRNDAGVTQFLPAYRPVSNFNIGLFCQQAGLSLDDTLSTAGLYARLFSSNADSDQPYGLNINNAKWIRQGYDVGESGAFAPEAAP
jgi:hypothetical protein